MSSSSSPRRDSWRGSLAILFSLLGLSSCVCLAIGLSVVSRFPGQLDHYLPLTPGTSHLYRVSYGDGSQGFASANVMPADDAALAYAGLQNSRAVQVRSSFTNWQGGGETYERIDYYGRNGDTLLLIAQKAQGKIVEFDPPVQVWAPDFLNRPIDSPTTLDNTALTYHQAVEGKETITLPDGQTVEALKVSGAWRYQERVVDQSITWYAPNVGVVRDAEYDGDGKLLQQIDLLNSTQFSTAAASLPLAALLSPATQTTAFFREDAARTGAHLGANFADPVFKIAYRLKLNDAFTASPAVADGLLYVADQAGRLTALDAVQGTPHWQFGAGGSFVAAPAVANGMVYIGASDKTLYALEARHGLFLWRHRLHDNVATSPVIADGLLLVGGEDRTLYALDALTGEARWTFIAGDRIISSPAVADGRVFFGADDALLYALDAKTGNLLWRYALDVAVEAAPAVSPDGIVYVASTGAQLSAVKADTGEELWSAQTRFGFTASPAVGDKLVFVGDQNGALCAYDRYTGQVVWQWQSAYGARFVGSPLLLGKILLAADTTGTLYVLEADTGTLLQQNINLGDGVSGSPTWSGETLFITTQQKEVFALQPGTTVTSAVFKQVWQYSFSPEGNPEKTLRANPVYANGTLYAALYNGDLVAVDAASGTGEPLAQFGETIEGTPAYRDEVLYVATRAGSVLAYDLSRKETVWCTQTDGNFRFGPAVDDQRVYVHSSGSDGKVYALDRRTGASLWQVDAPKGSGTPVLDNDLVYVSADALLALDPRTGQEQWRSTPFISVGSLAVYNGVVYAGGAGPENIAVIAVDAQTGKTVWQREESAVFFASAPSYDPLSGTLCLGAVNGQLYLYDARTGEPRARFQADGAIRSNTQIADGVVIFTTYSGTLYAVNTQTGNLLSNFKPGSAVYTFNGPLVQAGRVYAVHGLALYALEVER